MNFLHKTGPSSAMSTHMQGQVFQFGSNSIFLCLVNKVWGAFHCFGGPDFFNFAFSII